MPKQDRLGGLGMGTQIWLVFFFLAIKKGKVQGAGWRVTWGLRET